MKSARFVGTIAVVVGLAVLLVASTAESQGTKPDKLPPSPDYDVKVFHGSMCQVWSYWTRDIIYDSHGVWNANESLNGYVVCPVVRDEATGTAGVHMARITVFDNDPNGDISCTLHPQDKWGECLDASLHATAATSGTPGLQILDLTVTASAEYGAYYLGCDLPPRTPGTYVQLRAYRIYELQDGYDGMTDYDN